MQLQTIKQHWENVYATKTPQQVSWTQEIPQISLDFIHAFNLPKSAKIIDVGGGDSRLVDFLLAEGYEHITVLDISANALERAKSRLGKVADKVTWIVSDIADFKPAERYDIWHDRAAFHFLTAPSQIIKYQQLVANFVGSYLVMGTFSTNGPLKCSGLEISQYNEDTLCKVFEGFEKIKCFTANHTTPFDTVQNFQFCSFKKRNPTDR